MSVLPIVIYPSNPASHAAHKRKCPPMQRLRGTCAAPIYRPAHELDYADAPLSLRS